MHFSATCILQRTFARIMRYPLRWVARLRIADAAVYVNLLGTINNERVSVTSHSPKKVVDTIIVISSLVIFLVYFVDHLCSWVVNGGSSTTTVCSPLSQARNHGRNEGARKRKSVLTSKPTVKEKARKYFRRTSSNYCFSHPTDASSIE